MPLQECQRLTTSLEFVEWCQVLNDLEWGERTREEFYLAQIAAEIRVIREGFSKEPKPVKPSDLLLDFMPKGGRPRPKRRRRQRTAAEAAPPRQNGPAREYAPGPELVQDPKWWAANVKARAVWLARLGGNVTVE